MSNAPLVAGMSTCFCEEHSGGHPVGDHDPRIYGFYCGEPTTCLICAKMKAERPEYAEPLAPHVHAYKLPPAIRPAVGATEEEEEWEEG